MQIEIDPLSEVALYQQLRDRIVEGIAQGELRVGDQLAPVRTLAAQFGINIATVGKGYELLRNEGLIRTNRTSGSVVTRAPGDDHEWSDVSRANWMQRLSTVLAEGVAQGERDNAIAATVHDILEDFAAARADSVRTEGDDHEH